MLILMVFFVCVRWEAVLVLEIASVAADLRVMLRE